jgi:hypothetical protein
VVDDSATEEVRPGGHTSRSCEELDRKVAKIAEHLKVQENFRARRQLEYVRKGGQVRNDLLARVSTCRIYDSFMRFHTRQLGLPGVVVVGVGDSSSPAITSGKGNLRCMQPHSMLDLADNAVDNWPNRWRERNGLSHCPESSRVPASVRVRRRK